MEASSAVTSNLIVNHLHVAAEMVDVLILLLGVRAEPLPISQALSDPKAGDFLAHEHKG